MRDLYESGINRHPPEPTSTMLPDLPEPTPCGARLSWPSIVQYRVYAEDGSSSVHDVPPVEKAERIPSRPDISPAYRQPRTLPYVVIVHDLARYERLKSEGHLSAPEHTGGDSTTTG